MKLTEQVALVGSGRLGLRLTDDYDCNVYMLDGGSECALIDAGGGIEPERIARNIDRLGYSMDKVRQVLLTHAHADHAAGAAFWKERYGMRVVCPRESAPWVQGGDLEKTSLRLAIRAGVYPAGYVYPSCPIDQEIGDGDVIGVGDFKLEVIDSPGHARGHVCYLTREDGLLTAFSGDVLFAGGSIVLQNSWDCSIQEYAATMARLHAMRIERLYPGHRAALMHGAHVDIASAHNIFEGLGIPPGLS